MKAKTMRRALFMSVISLMLCMSMLVGTTFAWFTDSVTSANNIIKSGNLDVELYYQLEKETGWTKVDAETNVFMANALWEPGHTEVVKLKVVNEGSLALKYQLGVNVAGETGSVNALGAEFLLSDYIKFGIIEGAQNYTREQAVAAVDATANALNVAYSSKVLSLLPKTDDTTEADVYTDIVTLVVYMPTDVGNEANHAKDAAQPIINLGINLVATQYTSEDDSFGKDYDAGAYDFWDGVSKDDKWYEDTAESNEYVINTAAELAGLAAMVNEGNSFAGKTIKLNADLDLGGIAWTPIGSDLPHCFSGTFDGNGHTIRNLNVQGTINIGLFGYAANGGNVKNLTVKNATAKGGDYVGVIMGRGYTDIDNCHVVDATVTTTPYLQNGVYDGGAKAGGIIGQMLEGAGNTVTNCSVKNVKVYGFRDIGGVVGMVHNENSCSGNTASNVTLGYILCDQITADKNENAGAIYGRVQASATVSPAKDSAENMNFELGYIASTSAELESVLKAVNNGQEKVIILTDGEYSLRFTNNTAFNANGVTIIGQGNNAKLSISSSEAWYGRVQGDDVTFENIHFTSAMGTTGKATYNNCVFDNWAICAVNNVETYYNKCVIKGCLNTSSDFDSANVYVKDSTVAKAEYSFRSANSVMNFENCEIGELISWNANTVLTSCDVTTLDNSHMTSGTITIN